LDNYFSAKYQLSCSEKYVGESLRIVWTLTQTFLPEKHFLFIYIFLSSNPFHETCGSISIY